MFTAIYISEFIGKELLCMPQCHSTNDFVIQECKNKSLSEGFLCITPHQTAGRGQRGNAWMAQPRQNLTFSFIIFPKYHSPEFYFKINMLVSLAIVQHFKSIEPSNAPDFTIKWPNDLYFKNQKIVGILIESVKDCNQNTALIVGIGININQTDFGYLNATSLATIFKSTFDLQAQLQAIVLQIESYLQLQHIDNQHIIDNLYTKNLFCFNELKKYKIANQIIEATLVAIDLGGKIGLKIGNTVKYYQNKEIVFLN